MSHGHLMATMLIAGLLLVLVPIGIGILVAGNVIHDRRKAARRDGPDGKP
jgi:cytochrome c biogenesis protein CcdA